MLKKVLKLNGVQKLEKTSLQTISGGANETYYCWSKKDDRVFHSTIDISSSTFHCTPIPVVTPSLPDRA